MDWVTALPPSGDKIYNACLVIVDRYSTTPIFLPCHKDDTAMNTAILLWTYHPQTDGLAERIIQALEDTIRRFCAYGLELKDSDGFAHDWCTLIPSLELAYQTSVHSSTGQTIAMLEKGWNSRLPAETLREDLIEIPPTASSFKIMLDKVEHQAKQTDKELFPLRNQTPLTVPPVEQNEDKKIKKVIKERKLRGKNQREYLVRYRNPVHKDEWLAESEIPDSDKLSRIFEHERRPQA
ncbi:hypothetical protein O181_009663 [Austropuccinia psidii MF-1]|uniref:Integrase catalytic domain-containing protein n=1 Tax=Austropuccinia psidii MF-1 TaxID=1389203 RepID=A0A9Q3BRS3_9BASI|nr:hypothetical protein [Austropuccinia psidii MF-1]